MTSPIQVPLAQCTVQKECKICAGNRKWEYNKHSLINYDTMILLVTLHHSVSIEMQLKKYSLFDGQSHFDA